MRNDQIDVIENIARVSALICGTTAIIHALLRDYLDEIVLLFLIIEFLTALVFTTCKITKFILKLKSKK
ncbi:hypothetical protein VJ786_05595 [Sphingobacterium sp. PU5-4]|uniref:DUF2892 domain-containing protein n=1 Tax=Sphingobacterium tenebrionis TaxID=3111775 RepID=A0ABU8I3U5_9SPHI